MNFERDILSPLRKMDSSPYDILNMSLSKKENGRFVAAEFDDVRTLARKSNGLLNYYVADDNPKWQKKLE